MQGRCQGSSDRELSEAGIRQAEQICRRCLSNENIHAIYSSRLERARQTAELISRPHDLPVLIEEDLRELDHGELEGLTFNEIKEKFRRIFNALAQRTGGIRRSPAANGWPMSPSGPGTALNESSQRHQRDAYRDRGQS